MLQSSFIPPNIQAPLIFISLLNLVDPFFLLYFIQICDFSKLPTISNSFFLIKWQYIYIQ